jgi:hypothetical protein
MGYVAHDAVIVTAHGYALDQPWMPDVAAFREALPEAFRPLLVGPIPAVVNGDATWVFGPDGSKSGWGTDEEGDGYRERFAELFDLAYEDGSTPFDVVVLTYGADYRHEFDQPEARYLRPAKGSLP